MAKNSAIKCESLEFTYPDGNTALAGIDLEIGQGEKVALIGPNGAGKSTLFLQFNGILRGTGTITISEAILSDETLTMIRRKVGVLFQDPNDQLFCPTVFDDVAFGPLHFGMPTHELKNLVAKSLADVGLTEFENKSSHHLSLGERKRVAIASVLSCRPEILLMDEPTANLDPRHRREIINMLGDWSYTTFIATHDLDLAWDVCSRCIIINRGKVMADGPCQEILKDNDLLKANDLELPLRFQ
jgi:cobalt/nickel transport system ATP-binding protein